MKSKLTFPIVSMFSPLKLIRRCLMSRIQLVNSLGRWGGHHRNQTKLLVTKDRLIRFSQLALMGNLSGWKFEIVSRISPTRNILMMTPIFASLFQGRTVPQLASMDLVEEEVEGCQSNHDQYGHG